MENSQIEQPERFETHQEVDGDECPRCEHVDCICVEDEDANPMFPDDFEPDEDDMRDEYDEEAGI